MRCSPCMRRLRFPPARVAPGWGRVGLVGSESQWPSFMLRTQSEQKIMGRDPKVGRPGGSCCCGRVQVALKCLLGQVIALKRLAEPSKRVGNTSISAWRSSDRPLFRPLFSYQLSNIPHVSAWIIAAGMPTSTLYPPGPPVLTRGVTIQHESLPWVIKA
jgi:hypothetical protein